MKLSDGGFRVLQALNTLGPCSCARLAGYLKYREVTVSKYVTQLRTAELIRGEQGAKADAIRPVMRFAITRKGIAALEVARAERRGGRGKRQ